jgi:uncharacterized membrane protein
MTSQKSQRLLLPDLLKGIAVVLMIQVHLTELFARPAFFDSVAGKVSLFLGGPAAAPVFMAVMGYFLAWKAVSSKSLFLRSIKLIGLGILLNIGLNFHLLINYFLGYYSNLDPLSYIFGVDILFLAGLSMLVMAGLQKVAGKHLLPWILALLIAAAAEPFLPLYEGKWPVIHYVQAFFWGKAYWSYFPLFPWLSYPLAGFLFYRLSKNIQISQWRTKTFLIIWLALFAGIALSFAYGFRISINLPAYYHHQLLFVGWTMAFLAWWVLSWHFISSSFTNNWFFRYLQFCGRNVTVFYVVQCLLIGNIATAIYRTQPPLPWLLWLVGILALSSLLTWGYVRIRKNG